MKLAAKLMFVLLLVVMLMTAVGSYFSVRRGFDRFEQQQREAARTAADALQSKLADAWKDGGADGLDAAMKGLPPSVASSPIRWVWFERTQIQGGTTRTTVVEELSFANGHSVSRTTADENGRRQLQTYHPIDLGDAPRGGLEVTGSLDSLDAAARETMLTALVSLGAMALVSVGLVYIAGVHWVGRPLDRLIAKTERIGQGDFSEPLSVRGKDELSQLARALNDMACQLAKQQQQIRDETAERLATVEQLRHADRLKTVGRLAAGIAHELGTPLNVVAGRAGLIASGKLSVDEVASSAATIKSEADRITGIIRQLLDFARPGNSQRTSVDVGQLLRQTVLLIESLAEERNVRIEADEKTDLFVSVDRSQLQQVLTNLLVNAIQSMPQGGTVTASVASCHVKPPVGDTATELACVALGIRDEGTGISPENREHIFEPFFTTKDIGTGTGLGLSIAYGIVKEHHGWIEVETELGSGSCFTVYLPQE